MTTNKNSMNEMRRLAGIDRREIGPHGCPLPNQNGRVEPLSAMEQVGRLAVTEGISARTRAMRQFRTELTEGKVQLFADADKLREGLERARNLVQRALTTVQQDGSNFRGKIGHFSEAGAVNVHRADQELVNAVESIYAAIEAVEDIERAKRAWRKESRGSRVVKPARNESKRRARK